MSRIARILFVAAAILILSISALACLHHHDNAGIDQNCAVCQWLGHLAFLLPTAAIFIIITPVFWSDFFPLFYRPQLAFTPVLPRSPPLAD